MFTEEEMEIANRMFSMGIFKKAHFEELTRDHLFLPTGQNEILFGMTPWKETSSLERIGGSDTYLLSSKYTSSSLIGVYSMSSQGPAG